MFPVCPRRNMAVVSTELTVALQVVMKAIYEMKSSRKQEPGLRAGIEQGRGQW